MSKVSDGRPGHFIVEDAVFTFNLTPFEGWVYMAILKHANRQTGVAFPGIATLAKICNMSKRQVSRCIDVLEEKKIIKIERDTRPLKGENRKREVNHYTVLSLSGNDSQSSGVMPTSHNNHSKETRVNEPEGEKPPVSDPLGDSMNTRYVAYLDTWRNAHEGVKPLALRGNQRTTALEDVKDLIEMGVGLDDIGAFVQERQKNNKPTSWNLMVRDIHEFMTRKQKKAASKSSIPTINGNVVYIEETDQTMIWNADRSSWDTFPGKHESRPA